jgi:3-hydroxybenzoate 6-monooxygenase
MRPREPPPMRTLPSLRLRGFRSEVPAARRHKAREPPFDLRQWGGRPFRLSDWKVFNLVVTYHNDAPAPVAGLPVTEEKVMTGFQHVHPKARDIIRHGHDWKLWVLCDRDPVENWIDGRVALLGDAAHPTLQYMAQGACMAMEDGVCLSHELAASPGDHEAALERYRRQRVLRTARIQLQSRAMGEHVLHPTGAHAALRNSIMSAKSDSEWYDTLAWLYGSTGLAAAV